MTRIYDITVPAQIGMKSFAAEVDRLRGVMARVGCGGYVEFPLCKRVFITPTSQRIDHAVYVFRIEVDASKWGQVVESLHAEFYGKAPYTIAVFTASTAHVGAPEEQGSLAL